MKSQNSDHLIDNQQKLYLLRQEMHKRGIDWLFFPRADRFANEYLSPCDEILAWLTGFTGSNGQALIGHDHAFIYTDGRYTLQIKAQVDADIFTTRDFGLAILSADIKEHVIKEQVFAINDWLVSINRSIEFKKLCDDISCQYIQLQDDIFNHIWLDRPTLPSAPVSKHPVKYAGADLESKLEQVTTAAPFDHYVLIKGDSIAWLLNIRGQDIPCNPLALSYAIIDAAGQIHWYIDLKKLSPELSSDLEATKLVKIHPIDQFELQLQQLKGKIGLDFSATPLKVKNLIENSENKAIIHDLSDPCQKPKAIKNKVELKGMTNAHIRDGVAMVRFLHWLEQSITNNISLTEIDCEQKLAEFRSQDPLYQGPSFETIVGSGANSAIIHYRVTAESNRKLCKGELFLLDSGGQYLDGTTDLTRTMPIGQPHPDHIEHYTLVLQGHIAIARLRFPKGITGSDIDSFARASLWQKDLDYQHGTGHGVGCYLNVHEGPCGIYRGNKTAFEPGMIVSNEPGYYLASSHGIRIENLEQVVILESINKFKESPAFLGFQPLTLCPYERSLIDVAMLNKHELMHINEYHDKVFNTIAPLLEDEADTLDWLKNACRPIV